MTPLFLLAARSSFQTSTELIFAFGPSSQVTFSALRPCQAAHI
jgi:hypothetical protein